MKVAHVLRKCNPREWGGTETAVQRLVSGLRRHGVQSVVYSPRASVPPNRDPFAQAGHLVRRFHCFVPIARISAEQRRRLVAIGGNLMSFDLFGKLLREPGLALVHTHTLNRLGGIASTAARWRRAPLAVTVHGGFLDLPESIRQSLAEPLEGGLEWGKVFGWLFQSRKVLQNASAVITCNPREAELLRERFPRKKILVQPHGVPCRDYAQDQRAHVWRAFPELEAKRFLLVAGRVDPVKNQAWVVEQFPRLLQRHPDLVLALAGACTNEAYGQHLKERISALRLDRQVWWLGGFPPGDARLIGLFQAAAAVLLPSRSETFGLVILEAWAAQRPVAASPTSGAKTLIRPGQNGWLFSLDDPESFHETIHQILGCPEIAARFAAAGWEQARAQFDTETLAKRVKALYEELLEERTDAIRALAR